MFDRRKEFKKDLEFGAWGENEMINFIMSYFPKNYPDGDFQFIGTSNGLNKKVMKEWDLRFGIYSKTDKLKSAINIYFEIKTDGYETKTNNLIFEKSSNNKKSGVFGTTAHFFIYFLPLYNERNIYIIKPKKLIELLESNFMTHIVSGGDLGSNTFMYKINRDDLDELFIKAGGRIETYSNYIIPAMFDKSAFNDKGMTIYYGGEIPNKNDDKGIFDF